MAEIALLEVEEFERRKRWAKEDGLEELNSAVRSALGAAKKEVGEQLSALQKVEFVRRAMRQPRSLIGLAAADGLFSA